MFSYKIKGQSVFLIATIGLATLITLLLSTLPAIINSLQFRQCATIDDPTRTITTCNIGSDATTLMLIISGNWSRLLSAARLSVTPPSWDEQLVHCNSDTHWCHGHVSSLNRLLLGYRLALPKTSCPSLARVVIFVIALAFSVWLLRRYLCRCSLTPCAGFSAVAAKLETHSRPEVEAVHITQPDVATDCGDSDEGEVEDDDEQLTDLERYPEEEYLPIPGRQLRRELRGHYK